MKDWGRALHAMRRMSYTDIAYIAFRLPVSDLANEQVWLLQVRGRAPLVRHCVSLDASWALGRLE